MPNTIEPYLFFGGRCEEALAFYGTAIGAIGIGWMVSVEAEPHQ